MQTGFEVPGTLGRQVALEGKVEEQSLVLISTPDNLSFMQCKVALDEADSWELHSAPQHRGEEMEQHRAASLTVMRDIAVDHLHGEGNGVPPDITKYRNKHSVLWEQQEMSRMTSRCKNKGVTLGHLGVTAHEKAQAGSPRASDFTLYDADLLDYDGESTEEGEIRDHGVKEQ
ncbi:hypothetical protein NDU88_006175 [Pleurodeles waltl]|uniref:Uncharacterized protein n=1 Tax=Pleurodeles waltl TaxID=8319 RepID=A0AAV7RPI8_PLEWA|nr:hypothetical protein NDU88_006175 [Pleurodeles waltl]